MIYGAPFKPFKSRRTFAFEHLHLIPISLSSDAMKIRPWVIALAGVLSLSSNVAGVLEVRAVHRLVGSQLFQVVALLGLGVCWLYECLGRTTAVHNACSGELAGVWSILP